MTEAEVVALIGYINQRWPHAPLEASAIPVWLEDLSPLPTEECGASVARWAKSGERFPPTSGWVCSDVERTAQSPVPAFDDIGQIKMRALGRALAGELYSPNSRWSPQDTARAIEVMAAAGVHESVLRFAQEKGLRAFVLMPEGDMHALDVSQQADRRDMARHYRDVTVPGWQRDPRPGLALSRARESLGEGRRGELRRLGELTEGTSDE